MNAFRRFSVLILVILTLFTSSEIFAGRGGGTAGTRSTSTGSWGSRSSVSTPVSRSTYTAPRSTYVAPKTTVYTSPPARRVVAPVTKVDGAATQALRRQESASLFRAANPPTPTPVVTQRSIPAPATYSRSTVAAVTPVRQTQVTQVTNVTNVTNVSRPSRGWAFGYDSHPVTPLVVLPVPVVQTAPQVVVQTPAVLPQESAPVYVQTTPMPDTQTNTNVGVFFSLLLALAFLYGVYYFATTCEWF